ncbi:MAG: phosphotransferase family protein [Acidimicrobiales bacterium]
MRTRRSWAAPSTSWSSSTAGRRSANRSGPSRSSRSRCPPGPRLRAGRRDRPPLPGRLEAQGLEGLGRPEGFHERQVERWQAHLAGFSFRELPGLDEAAAWLRDRRPKSYVPGIMHGDYQFANVMFHHGAPARMAAIVDWEMGTVGDPLLDLAWVVMGWPDADEDRSRSGYVDYTGMPDRADLLERYATVSGRPVDEIDYYVILARYKMAIVLEGGYARYVQGGADNPKMAAFGDVVLTMAEKAAELAATTSLP